MQLRRITVRNFRKLVSAVDLDAIGDGVTVVAGDNEEGKSTLLDAIRTALFERHNVTGKPIEAMQPFGSSVRPELSLDFEVNGERYRIEKAFAQRPAARLTTPGGTFEGPEAEEALARLLRFKVPQRGASKADDRGVLGLFWLEQGRAAQGLEFGETGRATLRGALEDEVGDVLGGHHGRTLLEAARQRHREFFTATGRPTGDLAKSAPALEAAARRVEELEGEREEYDREIDALAGVRRELARIDADRVLETASKALAAARDEAGAIEALRAEVERATSALGLAEANVTNLELRWKHRQSLIQGLAAAEVEATRAREEQARLATHAGVVADRLEDAGRDVTAVAARRAAGEQRLARAEAAARIAVVRTEVAARRRTLEQVETLSRERMAARDTVRGIAVDPATFEALQDLDIQVREARAALKAVATRLHFMPQAGQEVKRGDDRVATDAPVEVTEPAIFTLHGFGSVRVEPGASELAERRRRLDDTRDALTRALSAAGASDLDQARSLLNRRTGAAAREQEITRLIEAHAREGEAALRASLAQAETELQRLDAETADGAGEPSADPDAARDDLAAARAAESAARDAETAANREHQTHLTHLAVAAQQVDAATRRVADTSRQVEDERAALTDSDLALELEQARAILATAKAAEQTSRHRLDAANPEEVELRRRKAQAALEQARLEQAQLREQAIALENRLAALGKDGIGEQLEEARGALERATRDRRHLENEARAWDRLVTTLTEAERDAKEAFLGPVLERVNPFLQLILPESRVALDEETLEITGVRRGGRLEPYEQLSVGTREQIAILVRLAFAVYLREKDYPAAVILDDALVYADDDRFERMQLALHKAAESVQILILTCRPRDWRQFGAPIRRLAAARTPEQETG